MAGKYRVALWRGYGYFLNDFVEVEADDEEEALVKASALDPKCLAIPVEGLTQDEYVELETSDTYVYLDRSSIGLGNVFLLVENATVKAVQ